MKGISDPAGAPARRPRPAAVEVDGLVKAYGRLRAVDGVSFRIEQGETFALLGPNGAGKSSTIEILEGYHDRTAGEVRVLGVDPRRGGRDWRARLGIVLQSSEERALLTVRQILTQFAAFYPRPRPVQEVIELVGLTAKAGARVSRLSGGQRRRVDVALGIIGRPEVLFLDEPTTGFDPEARRTFWEVIRGLKAEGTTILLTTHYLEEAEQLADRAGILSAGRLVASGAVRELGGAEARIPVVRWREHAGGPLREERSTEPGLFVAALVARLGGEPPLLEVVRPSLEDVYLGLIGADGRGRAPQGRQQDDPRQPGEAGDEQKETVA